jgi:hypothetical protein
VIQDKDGHPYLYGRGGVDDGYAPFAALLAIKVSGDLWSITIY